MPNGASHRLPDQRKVVHLHELAKDKVHLALLQLAADVRRVPETVAVQVTLPVLHLLKVDPDVRRDLSKPWLRLVHLQHLERDRVVVGAHRSYPALEHDASLKGQVGGIAGRAVPAFFRLQQTTATSTLVASPGALLMTTTEVARVVVVRVMLMNVVVAAATVMADSCAAHRRTRMLWNWDAGTSLKWSVLFLWLNKHCIVTGGGLVWSSAAKSSTRRLSAQVLRLLLLFKP